MEARFDRDHFAFERWWIHLSNRMAIRAVQIWMRRAFSLVPTKLFTLRFCFSALKEQLDLPAVFVDGRDGGGAELHQVGQQLDLPLAGRIPHRHAPKRKRAVSSGFVSGELNQLVGQNTAVLRNGCFFQDLLCGVVLEPGDEVNLPFRPPAKQPIVVVTAIHGHEGAGMEGKRKRFRQLHIATARFGDQDVAGHVIVVIEQNMSLHAPFRSAELRPGEELQAKADGRGVEREQFVFEPELAFAPPQSLLSRKRPSAV